MRRTLTKLKCQCDEDKLRYQAKKMRTYRNKSARQKQPESKNLAAANTRRDDAFNIWPTISIKPNRFQVCV